MGRMKRRNFFRLLIGAAVPYPAIAAAARRANGHSINEIRTINGMTNTAEFTVHYWTPVDIVTLKLSKPVKGFFVPDHFQERLQEACNRYQAEGLL